MLNRQKIDKYLATFKRRASLNIKKGRIEEALLYITAAAKTRYDFYIGFQDEELEKDLMVISSHLIKKSSFKLKTGKRCVFYSKFIRDSHGLTQQYVDALIANGYSFLFIHEKDLHQEGSEVLCATLEGNTNVECCQVPIGFSLLQKAQWLYDTICDYGACKLLLQLRPDSAYECAAFYALPQLITRYQINLTDHAYWIGTGCTDFTFEFRQYGCFISHEKRGFKNNQLLLLPFYPVMKNVPFEGFPLEARGKTVFFSGGSLYKISDNDFTFFKLCKGILDADSQAVILFACDLSDKTSLKYIKETINMHGIDGRFLLLGHRHDIYEVFRHVDVYINTFPIGGGLMCQFAAHCCKPILNYGSDHIEDCISQKHTVHFSFDTIDSFVAEAVRLSKDVAYRQRKGKELNSAVYTVCDFNRGFEKSFLENTTQVKIDLTGIKECELDLIGKLKHANNTKFYHYSMTRLLRKRSVYIAPGLCFPVAATLIKDKLIRKCKRLLSQ